MRSFDEIVKEHVDIEMCEGSHATEKHEFENELDFYLENVCNSEGSYEGYLSNSLSEEESNTYDILEIWNAIEKEIREAVEMRN
ncbi:hypothetical protein COO03_04955 [Bacillus sp. AFS098217]|uniref:hypothetical protein n=1 Tax=Bacillus sp. AFS098217 TaxID=2033868 RepID=UPI000BECDA94|nr:hypothetical protein [Bacillus sp. AFS098217]PEB54592.1 hypothetical protein COO03_04955 [Bacillus sp. AFS098217]